MKKWIKLTLFTTILGTIVLIFSQSSIFYPQTESKTLEMSFISKTISSEEIKNSMAQTESVISTYSSIEEPIADIQEVSDEILPEDDNNEITGAEEIDQPIQEPISIDGLNLLNAGTYKITAYDLSYQCCGKHIGSSGYGMTASGKSLVGLTREQAMVVAAQPSIFPYGTKLYIKFYGDYEYFSGIYTVADTGGFSGNTLDLFMGDFNKETADQSCYNFGVRYADVYIIQ